MRVTFVVPPDEMTGGMRVIVLYADHLRRRGHDVTLVALPGPRTGFLGGTECEVRTLASAGPVRDADLPDADVVVATWWRAALWAQEFDHRKGVRVYFMQDYGAPGQETDKLIAACRASDHVVTIARWLAQLVPNAAVDVVPNAVDHELFHQPHRTMPARPAVGFAYREARTKGFDLVLKAVRRARRTVKDLRLLTFGAPPRRRLPRGVEHRVSPPDRDLAAIYGACTAWLFASRLEGFGLPILEAMACRTPVIATPAGVAPEVLARGGGWLVPHEDHRSMAEAIVAACRLEPDRWCAVSDAAHANVADYTWSDAGDAFESAIARSRSAAR